MDHNKTYLFGLLYDDQGIGETPGERAQDRVERLHQAIDRDRFKGYHLALTVRVEGDRNPARTDRFMDTLRSVVKTG